MNSFKARRLQPKGPAGLNRPVAGGRAFSIGLLHPPTNIGATGSPDETFPAVLEGNFDRRSLRGPGPMNTGAGYLKPQKPQNREVITHREGKDLMDALRPA